MKKKSDMELFCEIFNSLGFKKVKFSFNGYGNSGQIENISLVKKSGKLISNEDIKECVDKEHSDQTFLLTQFNNEIKNIISEHGNLSSYLKSFLWNLLPMGFETGEGSWGTIEVDLKTWKIDLDQNVNPDYDGDDSEII